MTQGFETTVAGPTPELLEALRARHAAYLADLNNSHSARTAATGLEDALSLTEHVDDLVRALLPSRGPADFDVVALGSYGRHEMCPYSDVDLLFLIPDDVPVDSTITGRVETVLYGLWDLRFEVGHAVRTVAQTLEVADREQAELTSLLDARLVLGDPDRFARLPRQVDSTFLSVNAQRRSLPPSSGRWRSAALGSVTRCFCSSPTSRRGEEVYATFTAGSGLRGLDSRPRGSRSWCAPECSPLARARRCPVPTRSFSAFGVSFILLPGASKSTFVLTIKKRSRCYSATMPPVR